MGLAGLLITALLVAGCAGGGTINGSVTLTQNEPTTVTASSCAGTGGYSDIASDRTNIVVKNEAGTILATGTLQNGSGGGNVCRLTFAIKVPDAKFYSIEIARRSALTYSFADMVGMGWTVDLTLGS